MSNSGIIRGPAVRLRRAGLVALLAVGAPLAASHAIAAEQGAGNAPALALAQAETPTAQAAGEAELKALTEEVLRSLGAASGATTKGPSAQPPRKPSAAPVEPGDYKALMNALSTLVERATRQGKTSEDILALIQEALASQDEETLDALIAQAGGKVELQKLLRALVQKAAMKAAADDPYTRMLQAEGEATRVQETTLRAGAAGAAAMDNAAANTAATANAGDGGRLITVQPGDTLRIIALRHYGSARRWRDIYQANRDRLNNPDLVPAGIRLRLP